MRSGRVGKCWLWGTVTVTVAACSSLPYSPRPLNPETVAPEHAQRSGSANGLKRFAVANGYAESAWPPAEWGLRELTLASPIDHPGSTAITLVTGLLRDELTACREEGLWDIKLA